MIVPVGASEGVAACTSAATVTTVNDATSARTAPTRSDSHPPTGRITTASSTNPAIRSAASACSGPYAVRRYTEKATYPPNDTAYSADACQVTASRAVAPAAATAVPATPCGRGPRAALSRSASWKCGPRGLSSAHAQKLITLRNQHWNPAIRGFTSSQTIPAFHISAGQHSDQEGPRRIPVASCLIHRVTLAWHLVVMWRSRDSHLALSDHIPLFRVHPGLLEFW
ncbi:MAG TPA: hypothetical protein VHJ17_20030 [Thermomonospora sp.]|nr:hypothetical protein [Thermomonospora sp.]